MTNSADVERFYFLLVHGAWHGAWCFGPLIASLASRGFDAGAIDLPGHGLDARLPRAFVNYDASLLQLEKSSATDITAEAVVAHLVETIRLLVRMGRSRIILVGHSLGGLAVTAAAEAIGHHVSGLVYLAAFMLTPDQSLMDVVGLPENEGALVHHLTVADPAIVGAHRIDPRRRDAAYLQTMRTAFFNDVDEKTFEAALFHIVPDEPIALRAVRPTASVWGALPRAYIVTADDQAIRPALQRRMIQDIGRFSPDHPTIVRSLASGHSPFLSATEKLADILVELAAAQ
jgi:pimeloyl-ACP methyl ester carboxylesterase